MYITTTHAMRRSRNLLLAVMAVSIQSCYQYRVLNTNNDPSTEYQKTVMWSYAWGLVNKPKDFHIPNCNTSNAVDEVIFKKKFGHSVLTLFTLGIVSPVEVKWRCHKPCQRVGGI
jgi:Bor protein